MCLSLCFFQSLYSILLKRNSLIFAYNIFEVFVIVFSFIPPGIYCESCIPVSIPPQFGVHSHHSPDTALGKVSRDFCVAGIKKSQLGGLKQKKLICSQIWGPEMLNQSILQLRNWS